MINKKIALSGLSIVTSLAMMAGSAFAAFTSSATNDVNTFAAGTLELQLNGSSASGSTPIFTVPAIAPGQTKTAAILLSNNGTSDSTSTVLSSIDHSSTGPTPDLGDKLVLTVLDDPTGTDIINPDGSVTDLAADDVVRGSAPITSAAWTNIPLGFGLTASGSHRIILQVQMDPTADNNYQGANSSFGLNFQTSQ